MDPDESVGSPLSEMFDSRQYELVLEDEYSAVIEHLETESIDCIVLGQARVDTVEIDVIHAIRNTDETVPLLLYGTVDDSERLRAAIEAGVDRYVPASPHGSQDTLLVDGIDNAIRYNRAIRRTEELERVNFVIRSLQQELVKASTRAEIDEAIVEILADSDPYVFAWIGEHDPSANVVTPRVAAGIEQGYLDEIEITTDSSPTAQGPTGRAIRTGEIQVMQDIPSDPRYEPWRKQALERGYRSSAAVPLISDGTDFGVINLYANRIEAFDSQERALLEELADTIVHAYVDINMREEIRRFQRAVEQAVDAIFITDIDGSIEYVNPAFEDLTGFLSAEAIGRTPRILKSGEMGEEYYETMWETILGGEIWEGEVINARKSGDTYFAEQTVAPRRDATGDIEGFVAIQRDITARKEREQELEQQRERLRALFEGAPDGIVVHDFDGRIHDVNETILEMVGYSRSALLEMSIFDIEVGVDRQELQNEWEALDSGSKQRAKFEGCHRREDGSTYPVDVWVSSVTIGDDIRDRFIGFVRDITDRKAREREIRERTDRYEAVIENVHDGLVIVQAEKITFANRRMIDLTGYPGEELVGKRFEDLIPDEHWSLVSDQYQKQPHEDTPAETYQLELEQRGGDSIPVEVSVGVFEYEGEPASITAIRDISARADQARQLRVLERILRHNLRNAMMTIRGNAEIIQENDDTAIEAIESILNTSDRLMSTVEKQREVVELLADSPTLERIDASEVCTQAVGTVREDYPEATVELETYEEATVFATDKLERALLELIDNAVTHTDRKDPCVRLTIDQPSSDTVSIEIADNGPGIPDEEVNVLTRDYEIDPLYHGSGLGLWLVNWIVRRSRGSLSFAENEPRGSVVTIELRRAE